MLMVIFGAGASYDSVPHFAPKKSSYEENRPPLANELFDDRPAFVNIMTRFPAMLPLVSRLRGGVQVEHQLARFLDDAKTYPLRHQQLAAIRYYLHVMLWDLTGSWFNHHKGITNYGDFLDEIERWRCQSGEQVCFVTFNYDLMLDQAMQAVLGFQVNDITSYINQGKYTLIKLHGSVNWGRIIDGDLPKTIGSHDYLIHKASELKLSDHYSLVTSAPMLRDPTQSLVFPALAIPIAKKDAFECPMQHIEVLASVLPKVTKLITIGWRATEEEFINMLRMRLTGLRAQQIDLLIVSGDKSGADETFKNLGIGITADRYGFVSTGFSGLTREFGTLGAMLRQTPWQKGR
jgi:hypothetical protein